MSDTLDPHEDHEPLSERFLDLFVFLPTGLAVTLAEELPQFVERGRAKLGVRVNSARAVGQLVVRAGGHELKRRSEGFGRSSASPAPGTPSATSTPSSAATPNARPATSTAPPRLRSIPRPPATVSTPPGGSAPPTGDAVPPAGEAAVAPSASVPGASSPSGSTAETADPSVTARPSAPTGSSAPARPSNGHVPDVGSLAIPGFDTLSASQVVQRLDGLTRAELVAVRAYETSTRGRRTILSRVDQLLDERS